MRCVSSYTYYNAMNILIICTDKCAKSANSIMFMYVYDTVCLRMYVYGTVCVLVCACLRS